MGERERDSLSGRETGREIERDTQKIYYIHAHKILPDVNHLIWVGIGDR